MTDLQRAHELFLRTGDLRYWDVMNDLLSVLDGLTVNCKSEFDSNSSVGAYLTRSRFTHASAPGTGVRRGQL